MYDANSSKNIFLKLMPLWVMLCGVLWGLSGVLGQMVFESSNCTSAFLTSVRMIMAGLLLLIYLLITDRKSIVVVMKEPKWIISVIIFAYLGIAGMQYTYFLSIKYSNASTGTVLQYIYPVIVIIWTSISTRKLPNKLEVVAIICALIGIFLVSTHGDITSLKISPLALIWGIISAFAFTFFTVYPEKLYKNFNQAAVLMWAFLIGGVTLFVCSGSFMSLADTSAKSYFLIILIAILGTIIPFLLYGKGVMALGSVKCSLLVTIEPVASAVMTYFFTDTKFTVFDIIGCIFILVAVQISTIGIKNHQQK